MYTYLDEMKEAAGSLLRRLADRHLGLGMCAGFYRDHDCPYPVEFSGAEPLERGKFVGRGSRHQVEQFLAERGFMDGNGTLVEALGAAMHYASHLPWSAYHRIIVHAGDQPSHGFITERGIPFGSHDSLDYCPLRLDHEKILATLKRSRVRCYMIRCGSSKAAEIQYREIAEATGGRYIDFASIDGAEYLATAIEASLIDATGGDATKFLQEQTCRQLADGSAQRMLMDSFSPQD